MVMWLLRCSTEEVFLKFNDFSTNWHLFVNSWNLMSCARHFVHRALLAAAGSMLLTCSNQTLTKIIRDGLKGNKRFFHNVLVCWSFLDKLFIKHECVWPHFQTPKRQLQKMTLIGVMFDKLQGICNCSSTQYWMFDMSSQLTLKLTGKWRNRIVEPMLIKIGYPTTTTVLISFV